MTRHFAVLAVAVLLGSAGSLSGCGDDNGGSGSATTVELEAGDFYFKPTEIKLTAGEKVTVTVKNEGSNEHNLTAEGLDVNKDIEKGETAEIPVTPKAGSFPFHCKYHPDKMKGTITVS